MFCIFDKKFKRNFHYEQHALHIWWIVFILQYFTMGPSYFATHQMDQYLCTYVCLFTFTSLHFLLGSLVHLTSRVHHILLYYQYPSFFSNSISFCSENVRIVFDINCCYEHKFCVQSAFVELINYGSTYISISKAKLQRKYVRTKQPLGYEMFYSWLRTQLKCINESIIIVAMYGPILVGRICVDGRKLYDDQMAKNL